MTKRNNNLYLQDIIDAIKRIEKYTDDVSFEKFSDDEMIIDAVIRNFEIIGEAAKHVPATIKAKYKNIPWKEMAGMRDKVIHEYFGVDLDIVWKTIKERLPEIKKTIKHIL